MQSSDSDFPGEDRSFGGSKLFVDLIPSTTWFTNVRSQLRPKDWKHLSARVRARVQNRCELCGFVPPISCDVHERFSYKTVGSVRVQKLMRLLALCKACHEVTHIGFASMRGREAQARKHLMKVNKISKDEADVEIEKAYEVFNDRSSHTWELDLSLIEQAGYSIATPPPGEHREAIVHHMLPQSSSVVYEEMLTFMYSDVLDEVRLRLRGSSLFASKAFVISQSGSVFSIDAPPVSLCDETFEIARRVYPLVTTVGKTLVAIDIGLSFATFLIAPMSEKVDDRIVYAVSSLCFINKLTGGIVALSDVDIQFQLHMRMMAFALKALCDRNSFEETCISLTEFLDWAGVLPESECFEKFNTSANSLDVLEWYRFIIAVYGFSQSV